MLELPEIFWEQISVLNAFHREAFLYSAKSSLPSESSFYASQPEIDATWMYTLPQKASSFATDRKRNLEFVIKLPYFLTTHKIFPHQEL